MAPRVTRRRFIQVSAAAGVLGSVAPILGSSWAAGAETGRVDGQVHSEDALQEKLREVLQYGVRGVERNYGIPGRLATVLSRIGGQPRGIAEARTQILLQACEGVERSRRRSEPATRSVTANLNDLLDALRVVPVSNRVVQPLIGAISVATLFATHGVHFEETREAHARLRRAIRELKDRRSALPLRQRLFEKKRRLDDYREAIARRRLSVSFGGHFDDVLITSVWISRHSGGSSRGRRR